MAKLRSLRERRAAEAVLAHAISHPVCHTRHAVPGASADGDAALALSNGGGVVSAASHRLFESTRLRSDTTAATLFQKPPFHNFGAGNISQPAVLPRPRTAAAAGACAAASRSVSGGVCAYEGDCGRSSCGFLRAPTVPGRSQSARALRQVQGSGDNYLVSHNAYADGASAAAIAAAASQGGSSGGGIHSSVTGAGAVVTGGPKKATMAGTRQVYQSVRRAVRNRVAAAASDERYIALMVEPRMRQTVAAEKLRQGAERAKKDGEIAGYVPESYYIGSNFSHDKNNDGKAGTSVSGLTVTDGSGNTYSSHCLDAGTANSGATSSGFVGGSSGSTAVFVPLSPSHTVAAAGNPAVRKPPRAARPASAQPLRVPRGAGVLKVKTQADEVKSHAGEVKPPRSTSRPKTGRGGGAAAVQKTANICQKKTVHWDDESNSNRNTNTESSATCGGASTATEPAPSPTASAAAPQSQLPSRSQTQTLAQSQDATLAALMALLQQPQPPAVAAALRATAAAAAAAAKSTVAQNNPSAASAPLLPLYTHVASTAPSEMALNCAQSPLNTCSESPSSAQYMQSRSQVSSQSVPAARPRVAQWRTTYGDDFTDKHPSAHGHSAAAHGASSAAAHSQFATAQLATARSHASPVSLPLRARAAPESLPAAGVASHAVTAERAREAWRAADASDPCAIHADAAAAALCSGPIW